MKFSTTLTYSFLFVVVAGAYTYFSPNERPPVPQGLPSHQLLPLEGDDTIAWIQIQNRKKKETVTLASQGEAWRVEYPVRYPADPLLAQGFVTALSLSTKARRLHPEEEWDEYGLENPDIRIGIETKRNKNRRFLYLGKKSPLGDYIFARWEREGEYFLLDANLKRSFDKSLYSLRDKRVFRSRLNEATKIRLEGFHDAPYEMLKKDNHWFWSEPRTLSKRPIKKERLDELLFLIRDLLVKDFLDEEKTDLAKTGLSEKAGSLAVWVKTEKSEILRLGHEVPPRDGFYARRDGENTLLLVARANIRLLFETFETMVLEAQKGS